MPAQLGEFAEVPDIPDIYTATNGKLRCNAIRLQDGNMCLHSPVAGLTDKAHDSLTALGKVSMLLAPNQYHNKGLAEYAAAFPDADVVAPSACHDRLHKITGLTFAGPEMLSDALSNHMDLIAPEGLKTGEVWLCTQSTWVVTDCFAGPDRAGGKATLLKTFPRYGISDVDAYRQWVRKRIAGSQPTTLLPCHGRIVQSSNLTDQLLALLDTL